MLFEIENLSKSYGALKVLKEVSISVDAGQSVGLVGESGSGKSTFINCALKLARPNTGLVTYDGMDVLAVRGEELMRFRREVQLVFQDPFASLNPRMSVEELVAEGLIVHRQERSSTKRRARVVEMLEMVGLDPAAMGRYPRDFSGGQRQRIAIARALAIGPRILVCDEPVSALDVSVQAQIINLLQDMQKQLGLGILFVAHDLAVVRHLCSEIVVLNQGEIVERGDRETVFDNPQHDYTRALLDAVPVPDPSVARARREQRGTNKLEEAGT